MPRSQLADLAGAAGRDPIAAQSRRAQEQLLGTWRASILHPSNQYFGRCDTAHSLACSMGARGGKAARSFLTLCNDSIVSRQRLKLGNLAYMTLPSCVRLSAKVLGRR